MLLWKNTEIYIQWILLSGTMKDDTVYSSHPSTRLHTFQHSRSLIKSSLGTVGLAEDANVLHADNGDSNQTARMRRLI